MGNWLRAPAGTGGQMNSAVEGHYSGEGNLAGKIAAGLGKAGMSLDNLRTINLATIDEFHIRRRKATLELGAQLETRINLSVFVEP
jgi:hypothetical protein